MEIRGLVTIQNRLTKQEIADVFEAFKIKQEISALKGKLEKLLKGNKSLTGIDSIVENAFKPNQLVLNGPDFSIERKLTVIAPYMNPGCSYYKYSMKAN